MSSPIHIFIPYAREDLDHSTALGADAGQPEKGKSRQALEPGGDRPHLQAWPTLPPPATQEPADQNLSPPFVPPAWTDWARKEYDTLSPLTALKAPLGFRLEGVYVELYSPWQTPAELEARPVSTQARPRNPWHGDSLELDARELYARELDASELDAIDAETEGESDDRRPLTELVALPEAQRLALRGGPGSGKSTFLRRLLLQQLSESGPEPTLPLYLELKELGVWLKAHPNGGTAPEQLIAWAGERLAKWGLSAEALTLRSGQGRILWLLDGLDEFLQDELRHRAAQIIGGYFNHASGSADRLVLAGRPHAFEDARIICNLGLENRVADLDRFTKEERAGFLLKWFAEVYPHNAALAHEQAEALTRAIPLHRQVHLLSRTPLLLSTMAEVYQQGRSLPERRADLYDRAVDVMLHRRLSAPLSPGDYTQQQARRALTAVAHGMMLSGESRALSRQEFGQLVLDALHPNGVTEAQERKLNELLQWLGTHSGLLTLSGEPLRVSFSHLGMRAFLCAEWYAGQPDPLRALGKRIDHSFWQEVVLLTGGILLMDGRDQRGEGFLNDLEERTRARTLRTSRTALLARVTAEAPAGSLPVGFAEQLKPRLVEVICNPSLPSTYQERTTIALCLGKLGDPRLGLEKPENWIWIEPGEFRMGSDDLHKKEKPIHKVTLTRGFYLSRFAVTNHDFKSFIDAGGYGQEQWWSTKGWKFCQKEKLETPRYWTDARFNTPNQPVLGVSWYEAEAFCRWMTGRCSSLEEGLVIRLPTEAEWEYAARGQEGRTYPWGNDALSPERANHSRSGLEQTSPVGIFPQGASPDGVLDLVGNVNECCWDWYGRYPTEAQIDPTGPDSVHFRVIRGGSWRDWLEHVALRWDVMPGTRNNWIGFRLVRGGSVGSGPSS